MSDLISRSEAMENYCNALCPKLQKGEYCNNCIVKAWLNNQPTAYDTDKVVEKLEKRRMDALRHLRENKGTEFGYASECVYNALNEAVEIVKGGGVE